MRGTIIGSLTALSIEANWLKAKWEFSKSSFHVLYLPTAHGSTGSAAARRLKSLSARIRDQLVDRAARCGFNRERMWHPVSPWACLEDPAADRLELPTAGGASVGTERTGHPALEEAAMAGA